MAKEQVQRQMIFTTFLVDDATDKINDGVVVKRYQNPWLKSEVGLRRAGVTFKMTPAEQQEYVRCALDVHYFTEQYCKVKTDDGSIGNIRLRDYQKDMMDNFVNNRFNILMASRQVGKTISSSIFMLHTILFNNDKNVNVILGEVKDIDKDSNLLTLDDGEIISYDYLILSVGSKHSYFGKNDWSKYSNGLKIINDALDIRDRILKAFEKWSYDCPKYLIGTVVILKMER